MNINRGLLIIGIVLAIIGFGSAFVINSIISPPTNLMVAARDDIPAGTMLNDLPEDAFVQVPVTFPNQSARMVLESILEPDELAQMKQVNGVFITDVYKFEPVLLSSIVSAENPASVRIAQLALDDPEMMIVTIPANNTVPEDIRPGDMIDLAVAVNRVGEALELAEEQAGVSREESAKLPYEGVPQEALVALLREAGYVVAAPEGEALPEVEAEETEVPLEPTATPLPGLREPVVKVIVHGARVVRVRRDQSLAGMTAEGDAAIALGEITALDVVIPRSAFEFVTMAANGGVLQVGLLSPLAIDVNEPTLGASLQDFLDIFYADREALAPTPLPTNTPPPTNTPEPTPTQALPTPTPSE